MKSGLVIFPGLVLPEDELVRETSRSGGPGGQNVNKVETRVTLRFHVAESRVLSPQQKERISERLANRLTRAGELCVHAQRHREQARNEEDARTRLAALVRGALTTRKKRVATRRTRGSIERRLKEKRRRSDTKRRRSDRGQD